MEFIDSHVHLFFPDYDQDRADVIKRAEENGVKGFINVGTDFASSQQALKMAEQYDQIWSTAGFHPHDAKDADAEAMRMIENILHNHRVVAIGEIGLDFFRNLSSREVQENVLIQFIEMQKRVNKPLVLHCRDAYEELVSLFQKQDGPPYDGVMHCYSSDKAMMFRLLDLGFYISFAGPLTYKKNDLLREACKTCPLDRLLLETDAPFLPPQTMRGKRNESSYMMETARVAADLHTISVEELGKRTSENTKRLFRLC